MQIVTITSDFGSVDPYVAMLKGSLLGKVSDLQIIDLSNEVSAFNVLEGCHILQTSYEHFPKGTIHLYCINQSYSASAKLGILYHSGHYFIGPDNGFFSILFPNQKLQNGRYFELANYTNWNQLYANAVDLIVKKRHWDEIGYPLRSFHEAIALRPVVNSDFIRASVIHVDRYGNITLNIDRPTFEEIRDNRNFELYYQRRHPIRYLVDRYQDVGVGEVLARFNSGGLLEIAIYMGNAAQMLGLELDQLVQIDFINTKEK